MISRWGILAKWYVPRHNEGPPMDLVPEARESFLSRSKRTQAKGGRIIVCVDWMGDGVSPHL
jgi:hypothetical protein